MLNDDIWNFANSLFCVTLLKYSGVALLVMILMIFINEPLMSSWLPMAFMIFTLLIAIISVEKKFFGPLKRDRFVKQAKIEKS